MVNVFYLNLCNFSFRDDHKRQSRESSLENLAEIESSVYSRLVHIASPLIILSQQTSRLRRCETGKNCLIKTVSLNIWQTNIPNTMISVERTTIIENIQSKVTVTVFSCRHNSSSTAAMRSSTRAAPAAKESRS